MVIAGFGGGNRKFAFAKRLCCAPATAETNSTSMSANTNAFFLMTAPNNNTFNLPLSLAPRCCRAGFAWCDGLVKKF